MTSYQEFLKYQAAFHEYLKSVGKIVESQYEILINILYQETSINIPLNIEDNSDIRTLYKKLILIHHPDKGGNPEVFIHIQRAYENNDIYTLRKIDNMKHDSEVKNPEIKIDDGNIDLSDFWKTTDAYKWFHNIDREYIESKYMTTEESMQYMKAQIAIMLTVNDKEKIMTMLYRLIYKWNRVKTLLPSFNSSKMMTDEVMKILSETVS